MKQIRPRDFIEDEDGWLYAVSAYDNAERIGCVLRYVPDENGERVNQAGRRYRKYDFEDAYSFIQQKKPQYSGLLHRIPHRDVRHILKPEEELQNICRRNNRVRRLVGLFGLPEQSVGCTGSLLCGLEDTTSDIDMVVYGRHWFIAQEKVRKGIASGVIEGLSREMWQKVYEKRKPEIPYDTFVLHEQRKWNRGQIDGTYFDILFTRDYQDLTTAPSGKGKVLGHLTIEATVTDVTHSFDNPAVYEIDHDVIKRVLSFTHTYSGQVREGEIMEACGVCEQHGNECWLIIGTTREARGEYIISKTLMEKE